MENKEPKYYTMETYSEHIRKCPSEILHLVFGDYIGVTQYDEAKQKFPSYFDGNGNPRIIPIDNLDC